MSLGQSPQRRPHHPRWQRLVRATPRRQVSCDHAPSVRPCAEERAQTAPALVVVDGILLLPPGHLGGGGVEVHGHPLVRHQPKHAIQLVPRPRQLRHHRLALTHGEPWQQLAGGLQGGHLGHRPQLTSCLLLSQLVQVRQMAASGQHRLRQ